MLVTGGSSGIGLATALKFAEAGAMAIIVARDQEKLAEARKEIASGRAARSSPTRPTSPTADQCDRSCTMLIEEHGGVDFLVNNAGRSIRRGDRELSYDRFHDFERTMQLNYFGALRADSWACCRDGREAAAATSSTSARSAC